MSEELRKIIWIPAVPSSGTSAVAGVLHYLGVDMGMTNHAGSIVTRGYPMWEDTQMNYFSSEYNMSGEPADPLTNRHIRLRDYINYRFIRQPEGRLGFKAPAIYWCDDEAPETLPVELVDVQRPLEVAIQSDYRRKQTITERNPKASPPSEVDAQLRAGAVAQCLMAKAQLYGKIQPKCRVVFDDLLANPAEQIQGIVEALELEPSEEQFETAVASIKPKRSLLL